MESSHKIESAGIKTNSALTKNSEIKIWLDSYDDMFSDFDPKPYEIRTVSDDFITQTRKVSKDQFGKSVILNLELPESKRKKEEEHNIAKNLSNYFNTRFQQLSEEKRKRTNKGAILTISGSFLMVIAGYISFVKPDLFFIHLLLILSEPAGWFMLWMGLDNLFYNTGKQKKEMIFYSKMASASIEFNSI